MKILKLFIASFLVAIVSGCASIIPKPPAEHLSGYSYIPIDPFSVKTNPGSSCENTDALTLANSVETEDISYKSLLESLPDNAVRVSIQQYLTTGQVTYGVGSANGKIDSYKLTVDYINSDTVNVKFWIRKFAEVYETKEVVSIPLSERTNSGKYTYGTETYTILRASEGGAAPNGYEEFNLPVYVGVGLRVAATIESSDSDAKITGLGALTAQAESSGLTGYLVTQTLGINGQGIAGALPIQSELNPTTAQNAIVAVGSIKALLYEDGTVVVPRVVGLYLPFPGGEPLVNAIVSELSKERVVWHRPCVNRIDTDNT